MPRTRSNRSGFEQRLLRSMRSLGIPPGERITLGFSGGADSLALAAACGHLAPVLDIELKLVHVDHQLRPSSSNDAEACRELAHRLALPIDIVKIEPLRTEDTTGIGLEEAARRARYQALTDAASAWSSHCLMLAHQANDQAETMLMHLFRGAGVDGLAGMRAIEHRHVPWWPSIEQPGSEMTILRPLLSETRESVEGYLHTLNLHPVEDESNRSLEFDRNWVRHEILPRVLERWPGAIDAMQRSALTIQSDRSFLDQESAQLLTATIEDDRTLRTDTLLTVDRSLVNRALRMWLKSIGVEEPGLDVVARIHELVSAGNEARVVQAGYGVDLVRQHGQLTTLEALRTSAAESFPLRSLVDAEADFGWTIQLTDADVGGVTVLGISDQDDVHIRCLAPGDRWSGTRRDVTDDLRAAGIHPLLRWSLLAVCVDDGVLLIPAIYPTMYAEQSSVSQRRVGVRWYRQP